MASDTSAAATVDYDAFDTISSELHDLDTEQSEARYDPRILSRELLGTVQHRSGGRALDETNDDEQSETATGGGAHCIVNAERRYEHGDKVRMVEVKQSRSTLFLSVFSLLFSDANDERYVQHFFCSIDTNE